MLRPPTPRPSARRGFTLIELLVVIAIIGILIGLIMAAVQRVRLRGLEVDTRNDLSQLGSAVASFKGAYNRNPPCSGGGPMGTFRLCSNYIDPSTGAPLAGPEVPALTTMFPRMNLSDNGLRINGTQIPTTTPIFLDPNQCLVFFLSGGSYMEYLGFATNPTRPFAPVQTAGEQRKQPLFEFRSNRRKAPLAWLSDHSADIATLTPAPSNTTSRWEAAAAAGGTPDNLTGATINSNEPWFLDAYGTPYLYMAASGQGSGGDYPFHDTGTAFPLAIAPWGGRISSFNGPFNNPTNASPDNQGPTAFRQSPNKWVSHDGVQIVSGGVNGSMISKTKPWGFGPGGLVTFGTAPYVDNTPGGDDLGNFRSYPFKVAD